MCHVSLVAEITEPPAENLKYLGDTEKYGDHSEGVHGAKEDGFFKVFGNHALSHVKGLFQSTGITHVQWMDLGGKEKHGAVTLSWLNLQVLFYTDDTLLSLTDSSKALSDVPTVQQRLIQAVWLFLSLSWEVGCFVCDLRYCVKVQRLELVGVLDTRQHHSSVYALLRPLQMTKILKVVFLRWSSLVVRI